MNVRFLFLILISTLCAANPLNAQIAGTPGAFSRLGFGARGMGMGNALTAVIDGDISSFYNPAVTPFLTDRVAAVSYGLLSLDRSLNTLSYSQAIRPTAGFSVGIINAGVSNIDGRDADGFQTGELFTSENQFSFSFANRMSKVISLGIALKIYYYRLYENIASTNLGIDAGGIARLSDNLTLGVTVQDIGSKYKWDTSNLYGEQGSTTVEPFPLLRKIGLSYLFNNNVGLISLDLENSNENTNIIRTGGELYLSDMFTVRAGLDHWDVKEPAQAAPTFGFTLRTSSAELTPIINYAYVIEPYGLFGMHIISLSTRF
ncbi:MAG: hypothetical protein WBW71_02210 [Bacteroidota bacterium]